MRLEFLIGLILWSTSAIADIPCPTDTAAWRAWQTKEVSRVADWNYAGNPVTEAAAFFRRCPPPTKCSANFKRFADAQFLATLKDHTLGANVTDEKYYAEVPYPEMLEVPDELKDQHFLKLLDQNDAESLNQALKHIDGINAKITEPAMK